VFCSVGASLARLKAGSPKDAPFALTMRLNSPRRDRRHAVAAVKKTR
jgi:hypothetical protein